MGWNYFGTGHGKGQWDGATTHVKNVFWSEQVEIIGAMKLENATDVCNFPQTSMGRNILLTLELNGKYNDIFMKSS
jgi:hypothetical protein